MKKLFLLACALIMLVSACKRKDCIVWVASPWQQVLRNTPPEDKTIAYLTSAANEYEPFRIIIHNSSDQKMEDLTLIRMMKILQ